MHKHIFALILALAVLAGCKPLVEVDSKAVVLSIYIVSETKIEGGKYIDTPECPKVGFIPATPAMVVEKLESVEQALGNKALMINMYPTDAKKFGAMTEKNVGKKTLITLGDTPITAPMIQAPIYTPGFMLTYGTLDKKKFEADLRKLVK